jgi:hypothetical protein
MVLTEEMVDKICENVYDNLTMYEEESDFDVISMESTLRSLDSGFQEIQIDLEYRASGESETSKTTYYKSVYESNQSDLEQVIFDDIMKIVDPES